MIRILRNLHAINTIRYAQCISNRLYSSKSDDAFKPANDLVEENLEITSEPTSLPSEKNFNSKASHAENNTSVIELLDALPAHSDSISLQGLLEFYDRIKEKYVFTYNTIRHPKFKVLRDATELHLPELNTRELKDVFIAILPSRSIMHDKLGRSLAHALVKRASFIPFDQILFVDFLLNKFYKVSEMSKDYNMVRLTLQTMFLSKIEEELNNANSFEETMKILAFCENNIQIIPQKIVNSLTTSLLLAEDEQFKVIDLTSVIIFLSNFGKSNEHVDKLLRKMIELWFQMPATARDVVVLFKVLANKSNVDKDTFEQTGFIHQCVNVTIEQDERKYTYSLQNSFNRLGFVSVDLIEHLSKYFETPEQMRLLTIQDYIILCTACGKADYKPLNWDTKVLDALKTFNFSIYLTGLGSFDWVRFALSLDKLGHCDIRLIRNILNSTYLQKQKWYEPANLEKLRDILDRENVSSSESDSDCSSSSYETDDELPLYDDLKQMFGLSKLWTNVQIDEKVTVPYVMKMNSQTGDFLPFSKTPSLRNIESNELLIGVIVIPDENGGQRNDRNQMNYIKNQSRRLERKGLASIVIEESKWNTLKAYEKSLVFYTKVVHMMEIWRKKQLDKLGKSY